MRPEDWKLGISWIWLAEGELMSPESLKRFHEANVACVETGVLWEWRAERYDPHCERLKAVIGAFQDAGLTVWSVHVPGGLTIDISHPKYAQAGIELVGQNLSVCAEMGVDKIVLHPSFEPIADADRPDRLACCAKSVRALYRPDVDIAIENLPRTCLCNEASEAKALWEALAGVSYACVDVNHYHRNNVVDMLRAAAGNLLTVHISDDDGRDEKHWYPGDGVLRWNDILGTLEAVGYEGCFLYELDTRYRYGDPMKVRQNFDRLVDAYRNPS
ncbi:MAG TPA: TIM barrel protein [Clostridia bacterium]|nr:TIM barrel protein [Clostridia bacterium]